jgi:hypothetical protein
MMNKSLTKLLGISCVVCLLSQSLAAEEWTPLFNGKDTTGWKVVGEAKADVVDGVLVGKQKSPAGGNIFTEAEYDNFELRFTYKIDWPANSGIWFRFDGKGYQFDILKYKNPVAYSGTLYCPGKMFITTNLNEELENKDGWNEGQIYANGDHLILWLNGTKVGECRDDTLSNGTIGIQVHGGAGFTNMAIHLKKMEIRVLGEGDKPTPPAVKK